MKNLKTLTIVAIIALSFTACKKDRVCECTTTNSALPGSIDKSSITIVDASSRQAKANCVSTKATVGNVTVTETCVIK